MRKGAMFTRCAGRSSSRPSFWPMRNSPPGMRTRSFGVIFDDRKLQLAFGCVHAIENHAHPVADRKLAARALPHDLADVLLISVLVSREAVDRNQALDEQLGQLYEQSVFRGADHQRVEILPDALG